jgi:hypothetical protein
MTAPNAAPSVDELLPAAVELAEQTGSVPSRGKLMQTYRIGRPKAAELYRRLQLESAKRRSRRARRLAEVARAGSVRPRRTARVFDPAVAPTSPGMGPVGPGAHAVPVAGPAALDGHRLTAPAAPLPSQVRRIKAWPILLLALPAFVAIWSGWVGLGGMTGFGVVHPLPGIADGVSLNTAITLPIGLETYGTYALYVWLSGAGPARARVFARWSAIGSLALGAAGQVVYHLLAAAGMSSAPWWITTIVACLPVAVLGMGAALYHLVHAEDVSR